MTRVCGMAGAQCPRTPEAVVRITGVGDRALCGPCMATLERLGMDFRRLDESVPVPEWRTRSLARNMTDLVRSGGAL